jgi:ABC-type branched-subunit amino acid transport system substrate-binding protein
MHNKRWLLSVFGPLFAITLVAAACSDDSESSSDSGDGGSPSSDCFDGELRIGTVLPETGDLAFLGPPQFAGAELAIQDINAAGGVNGSEVKLTQGDSGDITTDTANQTVDTHLADGADAIVGAASSDVSFAVIDKITTAGKIHFSPENTSPDFTHYDDDGMYFRTAPSDVLQGRILADLIVEDGYTNIFIFARQDPYGEGLLEFTKEPLESAGTTVTDVVYEPNATDFAAEVDQAVTAAPDAIVLIGFSESEQIIKEQIAKGVGPADVPLLLVDGNVGNALGESFASSGELTGVRGTRPAAELTDDFKDQLRAVDPGLQDFAYGPETYDAIVIIALAAQTAGTDCAEDVAKAINGVTRGGTKCTSYEGCKTLLDEGKDIDYDGVGGPYSFSDAGEPTEASFAILSYADDNTIDDAETVYKFSVLDRSN